MNKPLIGEPIMRREDLRLLKGRGQYIDDIHFEGMLHAAVFRSSKPHGRILRVDTSRAAALPGVAGVFCAADFNGALKPIRPRIAALPGFENFLQLPLAAEKVRYVGEPIAVVAAESPHVAEDALSHMSVEIEDLPGNRELGDRCQPAALVHECAGSNVLRVEVGRGNAEDAFKSAPYTRRERFSVQRHSAIPMETRGLVAVWDRRTPPHGAFRAPPRSRSSIALCSRGCSTCRRARSS